MKKKLKTEKLPKILWAASVNLRGLYSPVPIQCKLDPQRLGDEPYWVDSTGDYVIDNIGYKAIEDAGHISFSSISYDEVRFWIEGARSLLYVLSGAFVHSGWSKQEVAKFDGEK